MKRYFLILVLCYLPIFCLQAQETITFLGPNIQEEVTFTIYLPPGYDQNDQSYSVIYFLHGSASSSVPFSLLIDPVLDYYKYWIENGDAEEVILVFPHGYRGIWANSYDGEILTEAKVIKEMVPYVDSNYRTNPDRKHRMIVGLSAGGRGAMYFLMKYPQVFSAGISFDGAFWSWQEIIELHPSYGSFFNDEESYYNRFNPLYLASGKAGSLRDSCCIKIVSAAFIDVNLNFHNLLDNLDIPHEFIQIPCPHEIPCIMDEEGLNTFAFFNECPHSVVPTSNTLRPKVHFDLFPNPASEQLVIDLSNQKAEILDITVSDLSGRKVLNIPFDGSEKTVIDLNALNQGMYFLRLKTYYGVFAKKFVVQD